MTFGYADASICLTTPCSRWSMVGDAAVHRRQRAALPRPLHEAAAQRVRLQARRTKRLRRHRRAPADAAVEDDRSLLIELARAHRELRELDVAAAGNVP